MSEWQPGGPLLWWRHPQERPCRAPAGCRGCEAQARRVLAAVRRRALARTLAGRFRRRA